MELTVGNVEEDNKLAFLLGSALRTEDTDQALTIYDNLIPRHIKDLRLEKLKEKARYIAELPEHEFGQLVINARSFSLAAGRSSMSQGSWNSATPSVTLDLGDDDNEQEVISPILNSPLSRYDKTYQEEDSGLASCKLSESFGIEINEDESSILYDSTSYNGRTESVRITQSLNPPYDEEFKVDSSTGNSSVDSPRSENSATQDEYLLMEDGQEMETLCMKEMPLKQQSYSHHETCCWDYKPSQKAARSSDDEDIDSLSALYKSQAPKKPSMQVDKAVNLGLYSPIDKKCDGKIQYSGYPNYQVDDRKKLTSKELEGRDKLDVNGNPQMETNYNQLRKPQENGYNTIPTHLSQSPVLSSDGLPGRKRKTQKKKDNVKKAEDCEGYKGDLPLNEVLSYITGKGIIVEDNHLKDGLPKTDKTKKKHEKNKKDKHKVQSKDKKKGDDQQVAVPVIAPSIYTNDIAIKCNGIPSSPAPDHSELKHSSSLSSSESADCSHSCQDARAPLGIMDPKGMMDIDDAVSGHLTAVESCTVKPEAVDVHCGFPSIADSGETKQVTVNGQPVPVIGAELGTEVKVDGCFTEVKKKKKKASSVSTVGMMPSSSGKGSYLSYFNNNSRFRPNVSYPVSSSSSSMHLLIINNHSHPQRDLSPSSFPALPGTPPRIEVRRNSCDGINTVSMDAKNDSDRESVQSLPVTHGSRGACELSPVYLVSYATMVAAPPKGDVINSSDSSLVSSTISTPHGAGDLHIAACVTPEKKTTVWKGSPRERRHSIGSSPEDKAEVEKPAIQRSRQKSGSQELLCRDIEFKGPSVTGGNKVNNLNVPARPEANSLNQEDLRSCTDILCITRDDTSIPKMPRMNEQQLSVDNSVCNNLYSVQASSSSCHSKAEPIPVTHKNSPAPDNTKKSNTNNKSVVFLDKRQSSSRNLGITFGFDTDLESSMDSSSHIISMPVAVPVSQPFSMCNPASKPEILNIPRDNGPAPNTSRACSGNSNFQSSKAGHMQGPRNGLIASGAGKREEISRELYENRTKFKDSKYNCSTQNSIVKSESLDSAEASLNNFSPNSVASLSQPSSSDGLFPSHHPPSVSTGAATQELSTSASTQPSTESLCFSKLDNAGNACIPVVYGLKIQPNQGCGRLMFIPPSNKFSSSSLGVCSFLRKQWTEVRKQRNNSSIFVTLEDD